MLRIEAYQWVAFQDGGRLAKSESPRDEIRHAAAGLQGQKLIGFTLRTEPAGGEFLFDLGGRVAYQCRGPEEDTLWELCTRLDPDPDDVDILSFTAAGRVSLFTLRGTVQETTEYVIEDGALAVQLGAAPNIGPSAGLGNSGVRAGPPSVS